MHIEKYKVIIFDLDDTLFDYSKTEKYAVENATHNLFCDLDLNNVYSFYLKANSIAKETLPKGDINHKNLEYFRSERTKIFFDLLEVKYQPSDVKQFITDYLSYSHKGFLIKGVHRVVKALKDKIIVVASNGSIEPRLNKLEGSSIKRFVNYFFCSEQLNFSKPDNKFFDTIIEEIGAKKEEVLTVGNNFEIDYLAAVNSGLDVCLIKNKAKKYIPTGDYSKAFVLNNITDLLTI